MEYQSLVEALRLLRSEATGDRSEPALAALTRMAGTSRWPISDAWSPGQEPLAAELLIDLLADHNLPATAEARRAVLILFRVTELMDVAEWADGSLHFYRTRAIRFQGFGRLESHVVALRLEAVAETHNGGGGGWHIHPVDKSGKHLQYKMLFDPALTQDEMSWERHGQGSLRWKDPSQSLLPTTTAKEIHRACLRSVLDRRSRLHNPDARFKAWAAKFERPGRTAYVAHAHVLPSRVTPWPPPPDLLKRAR